MRIWLISDIHAESLRGWDLPSGAARPDYDVLVIAGDLITRFERGVAWLDHRVQDKQVIYVGGNHESWGTDIDVTLDKAQRAAEGTNVHVLECQSRRVGNVTFIGATVWTDFGLFGNPLAAMRMASDIMNDYRRIRKRFYAERLRPADTLRMHQAARRFITSELIRPKAGPRVVVSHHCPFPDIRNGARHSDRAGSDLIQAAYCSDMTDLMIPSSDPETGDTIEPPDVWAFGHTHRSCDRVIGSCRVVSNPKGYGPYTPADPAWENPHFDPYFTIEI